MFERFFKPPKDTHNQTILVSLIQNICEFLFGYSVAGYTKGGDRISFSMSLYLFSSTLPNFTVLHETYLISFEKCPYLERSCRYIFLSMNGAFWSTQYKNISGFMFWIFFEYRFDIPEVKNDHISSSTEYLFVVTSQNVSLHHKIFWIHSILEYRLLFERVFLLIFATSRYMYTKRQLHTQAQPHTPADSVLKFLFF